MHQKNTVDKGNFLEQKSAQITQCIMNTVRMFNRGSTIGPGGIV